MNDQDTGKISIFNINLPTIITWTVTKITFITNELGFKHHVALASPGCQCHSAILVQFRDLHQEERIDRGIVVSISIPRVIVPATLD